MSRMNLLVSLMLLVPASQAMGQEDRNGGRGTIAGVVEDSTGAGIADVRVSLTNTSTFAVTSASGAFRLTSVNEGSRTLIARRIGFTPESVTVSVGRGTTELRIRLDATPQHVAPVVVTAGRAAYTGRLRGFYERRERGMGRFFTEADIAARQPIRVTDLIRTVPGA